MNNLQIYKQVILAMVLVFCSFAQANRVGNGSGDALATIPTTINGKSLSNKERLLLAFEAGSTPNIEEVEKYFWSGIAFCKFSCIEGHDRTIPIVSVLVSVDMGPLLPKATFFNYLPLSRDGSLEYLLDTDYVLSNGKRLEGGTRSNTNIAHKFEIDSAVGSLRIKHSRSGEERWGDTEYREFDGALIGRRLEYNEKEKTKEVVSVYYLYNKIDKKEVASMQILNPQKRKK